MNSGIFKNVLYLILDKWNTTSPLTITIGTVSNPVTRLLNVHGKLWCSIQGYIKILDTTTLQVIFNLIPHEPEFYMLLFMSNRWIIKFKYQLKPNR